MGRQIIDLVEVLVDRIEKNGYQQRAREDDIADVYKRLNEAECQVKHWRQARQDAIAAGELMQAEIEMLKGAMAADDQRLRDAEERVWPGKTWGCDAADKMADEILHLRQQLEKAQRQDVDAMRADRERLLAFVGKVRLIVDGGYITMACQIDRIKHALAELDGQPAPVAETAEGGT